MKTFLVGGAVRDKLLGMCPKDLDYVVIDTDHDEMIRNNFIPVGKSHSVYLHPVTRAEFTVARELSEDLERRDITINALAMDGDRVIDLFGGERDLRSRVLRHVKEENFYRDPLRVYRVARFKSQLAGFEIASDTLQLMTEVAHSKEFRNISAERILKELIKVLISKKPEEFFLTLKRIKALSVHFLELERLTEGAFHRTMKLLESVSSEKNALMSYAALFVEMRGNEAKNLSQRLLVSNEWERAAASTLLFYQLLKTDKVKEASSLVEIFYRMDAFRREFLVPILVGLLKHDGLLEQSLLIERAFSITKSISARDVQSPASGKLLGEQIRKLRIKHLESSSSGH